MKPSISSCIAYILISASFAEDTVPYTIRAKDRDIRSFLALYEHLTGYKVVGGELISGRATLLGNYKSKAEASAAIERLLENSFGAKMLKSKTSETVTVTLVNAKER